MTVAQAAKAAGVSKRSVERSKTVKEKGGKAVNRALMGDKISVGKAEEIARLPKGEQAEAVEEDGRAARGSPRRGMVEVAKPISVWGKKEAEELKAERKAEVAEVMKLEEEMINVPRLNRRIQIEERLKELKARLAKIGREEAAIGAGNGEVGKMEEVMVASARGKHPEGGNEGLGLMLEDAVKERWPEGERKRVTTVGEMVEGFCGLIREVL